MTGRADCVWRRNPEAAPTSVPARPWSPVAATTVRPPQGAPEFIDRGDGGINFSAVLGGEEYSGTGSGEADEITSDGFVYTGTMGHVGQSVDVRLEVTC